MGGGIRRGNRSSAATRDAEAAHAFEKDRTKPLHKYDSSREALISSLDSNREAMIIANAAVGFVAASNPAVASVVTVYRAGKICYKTVGAYNDTYRETHNSQTAYYAARDVVIEETKSQVKSQLIGAVVDSSLAPTDDRATARFLKELTKSIVEEEIGDIEKKGRGQRRE